MRLLCGAQSCTRWALIWLTETEEQRYRAGVRIFRLSSRAAEIEIG